MWVLRVQRVRDAAFIRSHRIKAKAESKTLESTCRLNAEITAGSIMPTSLEVH